MPCLRCKLRSLYYRLYRRLFLPIRSIAGGIYIEDQVTATFIKDGNVVKRIVGPKIHNRWADGGLDSVAHCLRLGCGAAPGLKIEYMRLGSQCSDINLTPIDVDKSTTNTDPGGIGNVKATSQWTLGPEIANICQVCLKTRSYTGSGNIEAALYNFGTQFTKPSGVDLKIEWTVTLSRA